jgi:hypothetical protein
MDSFSFFTFYAGGNFAHPFQIGSVLNDQVDCFSVSHFAAFHSKSDQRRLAYATEPWRRVVTLVVAVLRMPCF